MDVLGKRELLKKEILDDAEKKAAQILRRVERDAEKVKAQAEEDAAALKHERVARATAEAEHAATRLLATVPLEKVRMELAARQAMVQEVMDMATQLLVDLQDRERVEFMARLLADAAGAIDEADVVADVSARDRPLLDEVRHLAESMCSGAGRAVRLHAGADNPGIRGGVIARSQDGRKLVDHSIEARRRRLEPRLRVELAEMLFGKTDHDQDARPQND